MHRDVPQRSVGKGARPHRVSQEVQEVSGLNPTAAASVVAVEGVLRLVLRVGGWEG